MNSEIKTGDYIKGTTAGACPDHFGKVIGFKTEDGETFTVVHVPYSLVFSNLPGKMEFYKGECTKITPQEYFKHVLSRD